MYWKLFLFAARFCTEAVSVQEVSNEYWCSRGLLGVMSLKDSLVGMVRARVGRGGAISYLAGLLLAGVGGVVVGALLTAMILGALGGVATTFLYCILGCIPKG